MLHSKTILSSQTGASKLFCIGFSLFWGRCRTWCIMYYNIQCKVHNVILRNGEINCVFHFEKLSLKVIADPPFYSLVIKGDNNDIKSCFVFKRGGAKSAGRETAAMALMVHRTPWGYNDTQHLWKVFTEDGPQHRTSWGYNCNDTPCLARFWNCIK